VITVITAITGEAAGIIEEAGETDVAAEVAIVAAAIGAAAEAAISPTKFWI